MSGAFQYKPKFKDMRIRPPKPEEEARANDVHALKPGERPCEWPGCRTAASARAPKSRERMNEHYWFCQAHAGEYNRSWDFFAGMREDEVAAALAARATGERPTWQFKASRLSREAAAFASRMGSGANAKGPGAYADPLGVFANGEARRPKRAPERHLGRLERRALEEMDLEASSDAAAISTRYRELVKRFHPDANGGDRTSEHKLQRVLRAYKVLKTAKLV